MAGRKEVLWNPGENVGNLDLGNMQRFARAVIEDWMFGSIGGFTGTGDAGAAGVDRRGMLICHGDAGAPAPGAGAMTVTNLAGPIGQWMTGPTFPLGAGGSVADPNALPASWGGDPYLLVYWLSKGEIAITHAVGDATNPRWDLVCVKLDTITNDPADNEVRIQKQDVGGVFVISENPALPKRRKVRCTPLLIAGAPAGSPAMPAVPAGYVPLYAVKIPATFNAVIPVDSSFYDLRMPLGSFTVDVWAVDEAIRDSFTASTLLTGLLRPVNVLATGSLKMFPQMPVAPHSCRLVGVSAMVGMGYNRFAPTLNRVSPDAGGTTHFLLLMDQLGLAAPAPFNIIKGTQLGWLSQSVAGVGVAPVANVLPIWGTGNSSGYAARQDRSGFISADQLMLDINASTPGALPIDIGTGLPYTTPASGGILSMVRFHFAGTP